LGSFLRQRNIRSIRQFALLPYDEKRSILRSLNDEEFNNVLTVCKNMPNITMDVNPEVLDDEDSRRITAKAIVTVTVSLKREPMEVIMQGAPLTPGPAKKPGDKGFNDEDDDDDVENDDSKDKVCFTCDTASQAYFALHKTSRKVQNF
jgi:preprotein translocase subunit Sec63